MLFIVVYSIGSRIIELQRNSAKKKWGIEERDYDHEKWIFRFYVIAFFVGVPLLLVIALWQEIFKENPRFSTSSFSDTNDKKLSFS